MFTGLDHVGIAVKSLEEAVSVYRDMLGFELLGVYESMENKVKVAVLSTGGETKIELLEPIGSDSPVAKFLEKRGEGIHHIAVKVDNIEKILESLKEKGVTLVDEKPRIGAEGRKVAFIHPKSVRGVLLELVEE